MNSVIIEGMVIEFTCYENTLRISLQDEAQSTFDIEVYGDMAKSCLDRLKTNRIIRVVGHLKTNTWVDGQGKRHSHVYIVAELIELKVN